MPLPAGTGEPAVVPIEHSGGQPFLAVRVLLGLLLLGAAALKAHHLVVDPVQGAWPWNSSWAAAVGVGGEVALGLWLLTGLYPVVARRVSGAIFLAFAVVSGIHAWAGRESCGCFGQVRVDPRLSIIVDLTAVAVLAVCRGQSRNPTGGPRPLGILAACGAIGVTAAVVLGLYSAPVPTPAGQSHSNRFVVLQPEKWVGQRLPLLDDIEGIDGLGSGDWLLILYQHDCPKCHELLARLSRTPVVPPVPGESGPRFALIEVPPYGPASRPVSGPAGAARGRLRPTREWFVQTPVMVRVHQGLVTELPVVGP